MINKAVTDYLDGRLPLAALPIATQKEEVRGALLALRSDLLDDERKTQEDAKSTVDRRVYGNATAKVAAGLRQRAVDARKRVTRMQDALSAIRAAGREAAAAETTPSGRRASEREMLVAALRGASLDDLLDMYEDHIEEFDQGKDWANVL